MNTRNPHPPRRPILSKEGRPPGGTYVYRLSPLGYLLESRPRYYANWVELTEDLGKLIDEVCRRADAIPADTRSHADIRAQIIDGVRVEILLLELDPVRQLCFMYNRTPRVSETDGRFLAIEIAVSEREVAT